RSSGRKTAPNRRCAPKSSIRSGSSSESSALPRCVIAGSKERPPPHCRLRAGQSVHDASAAIALRRGVACPAGLTAALDAADATPITTPSTHHTALAAAISTADLYYTSLFRLSLG